jgi:hypothetical protein
LPTVDIPKKELIVENWELKAKASKFNFQKKTDILRKWPTRSQTANIVIQTVQLPQCAYCQDEVYRIGMKVSSRAF